MHAESLSARAAATPDHERRSGGPARLPQPEKLSAGPTSAPQPESLVVGRAPTSPFGSSAAVPPAPPPAAPCAGAGLCIPHVRQRSTWDCGVACLAAALLALADDREHRRPGHGRGRPRPAGGAGGRLAASSDPAAPRRPTEPRRSARLAGSSSLPQPGFSAPAFPRDHAALRAALCASLAGESVWTIDLAHLAARLGLRAELWTTAPGFTSAYASEPFYAPEAGVDRTRVEALFGRAEEAGVVVREREASLGEVFERLRANEKGRESPTVAIVLLDRNLLERLLRDERASQDGGSDGRGDGEIGRGRAPILSASGARGLCERAIETGMLPAVTNFAQAEAGRHADSFRSCSAADPPSPHLAPSMPYAGHYVILVRGGAAESGDGSKEDGEGLARCGCEPKMTKSDAPNRSSEPWPPTRLVLRDPAWPDRDRVVSTRAFERARKAYGTDQDILFLSA